MHYSKDVQRFIPLVLESSTSLSWSGWSEVVGSSISFSNLLQMDSSAIHCHPMVQVKKEASPTTQSVQGEEEIFKSKGKSSLRRAVKSYPAFGTLADDTGSNVQHHRRVSRFRRRKSSLEGDSFYEEHKTCPTDQGRIHRDEEGSFYMPPDSYGPQRLTSFRDSSNRRTRAHLNQHSTWNGCLLVIEGTPMETSWMCQCTANTDMLRSNPYHGIESYFRAMVVHGVHICWCIVQASESMSLCMATGSACCLQISSQRKCQ